jgi:hypothetical protein
MNIFNNHQIRKVKRFIKINAPILSGRLQKNQKVLLD